VSEILQKVTELYRKLGEVSPSCPTFPFFVNLPWFYRENSSVWLSPLFSVFPLEASYETQANCSLTTRAKTLTKGVFVLTMSTLRWPVHGCDITEYRGSDGFTSAPSHRCARNNGRIRLCGLSTLISEDFTKSTKLDGLLSLPRVRGGHLGHA
jgi:hypothetical protein